MNSYRSNAKPEESDPKRGWLYPLHPFMALGLALAFLVGAAIAFVACGPPPPPPSPNDVVTSAEACASSVIEDLTVAPTVDLLMKTAASCGMTVEEIYAWIANLVSKSAPDAGPDGQTQALSARAIHLRAWLSVAAQARAGTGGKKP